MVDFTKSEKRELRSLAAHAYSVELARELENLEAAFTSWHKDEINVFELDDKIHEYHSGPHKDLYKSYIMLRQPETMVARALAKGLIERDRLSSKIIEKIEQLVQFFKENS